jgi:hypothetical protein
MNQKPLTPSKGIFNELNSLEQDLAAMSPAALLGKLQATEARLAALEQGLATLLPLFRVAIKCAFPLVRAITQCSLPILAPILATEGIIIPADLLLLVGLTAGNPMPTHTTTADVSSPDASIPVKPAV